MVIVELETKVINNQRATFQQIFDHFQYSTAYRAEFDNTISMYCSYRLGQQFMITLKVKTDNRIEVTLELLKENNRVEIRRNKIFTSFDNGAIGSWLDGEVNDLGARL